jgi:hypothetical protein
LVYLPASSQHTLLHTAAAMRFAPSATAQTHMEPAADAPGCFCLHVQSLWAWPHGC